MMQHTPGPWEADGYGYVNAERGAMMVCEIRGWGRLTGTGGRALPASVAVEIQQANARLIAAAPDLLAIARRLDAFLAGLLRGAPVTPKTQAIIDDLRAAIAKAEGPTPEASNG